MYSRPHLANGPLLWDRFESRILEIVSYALIMMRTAPTLPEDERDLNQLLERYIRDALWALRASDTGLDQMPHLDAGNQPDMDDPEPSAREDMRPDFQWELKDVQARNREEYQRFYALECKRLGFRTSPGWVLNKQYVTNGIKRFVKREYAYGSPKSNASAAMIGYVQTMELNQILDEVNSFCKTNSVRQIDLSGGWRKDISFLAHLLDRPEVHSTPLLLQHLWIDLRDVPVVPLEKNKTGTKKRSSRTRGARKM